MENSVETSVPPQKKGWLGVIKSAEKTVSKIFGIETEKINPDSPQFWHVWHTLRKGGLNLTGRELLDESWQQLQSTIEEKSKAEGSEIKGYQWELEPTPVELQDEEYSLLNLYLIGRQLLDVQQQQITERERIVSIFGPVKEIRKSSQKIQEIIGEKTNTLWEQFYQNSHLNPENQNVQAHKNLIRQEANDFLNALNREQHPNAINIAIIQTLKAIEESRKKLTL